MSLQKIEIPGHYRANDRARLWCERHGLDPHRVAIPNTLVLDDEQRTVTVMAYYELDERGIPLLDGDSVVVGPAVVQLEAPALPWPE